MQRGLRVSFDAHLVRFQNKQLFSAKNKIHGDIAYSIKRLVLSNWFTFRPHESDPGGIEKLHHVYFRLIQWILLSDRQETFFSRPCKM